MYAICKKHGGEVEDQPAALITKRGAMASCSLARRAPWLRHGFGTIAGSWLLAMTTDGELGDDGRGERSWLGADLAAMQVKGAGSLSDDGCDGRRPPIGKGTAKREGGRALYRHLPGQQRAAPSLPGAAVVSLNRISQFAR
jgi:hypothetical protein